MIISSSDGFCSSLSFATGELGEIHKGEIGPPKTPATTSTNATSSQNTPTPTPTTSFAPPSPFPNGSHHQHRNSGSSFTAPSPPATAPAGAHRPASPARSNSASSIATQSSSVPTGVVSNPTLISGNVPALTATNSAKAQGVPITTPPETPRSAAGSVAGMKRDASESEREDIKEPKKRRIAPTPVEKS